MDNANELRYDINVPYNHPSAVKSRKKMKVFASVMLFMIAPIWIFVAIMSLTGNNPSTIAAIIFFVMAVICLVAGIYFVYSIKPLKKDEGKSIEFKFYDFSLEINQVKPNKQKSLTKCLYGEYKNKQYVSKVIEFNDRIDIKVYTGTYNGVPQIVGHTVPKDVIGDKVEEFKNFLKEKMLEDYIVKNK